MGSASDRSSSHPFRPKGKHVVIPREQGGFVGIISTTFDRRPLKSMMEEGLVSMIQTTSLQFGSFTRKAFGEEISDRHVIIGV